MGSYRNIPPTTLVSGGVMTGTDVIYSVPLEIPHLTNAAFQASWTGTPSGSFKVEASLDKVTWGDLGVSISDAAGSADSRVINLFGIATAYVRLAYTNASGTGVLTVLGMAKGV